MKFGERLLALQHEPWAHFYIQYDSLKETLDQISQQDSLEEEAFPSSPLRYRGLLQFHRFTQDEPPGSTLFLIQLNQQVEKIVLFFLQEQGRIAYQLAEHRREQNMLSSQSPSELFHSLRLKYHASGAQLLHLLQYVDLNTTGVRKILKKHDKITHWVASGLYFGGNKRSSYMLKPLLQEPLAAVCLVLETAIAELDQQVEFAKETYEASRRQGNSPVAPSLPRPQALQTRARTEPGTHSVDQGRQHRRVLSHAQDFDTGKPPTDAVLQQIYAARRRLERTSEYASMLATTAMLGRVPEEDEEDDSIMQVLLDPLSGQAATTSRPRPGWMSNQLNLLSTFLYMMNYYIVAPTSGSYAAKLGSSAGLAAIIIGMTPIAALISTLLYSWWTSHSYKAALVFASCASLLGNLFYGVGLPVDSLTIVLLGRLMNGFGSARSINRRYIADSYSRAERTAASAAFVTAGALGMAAGPAVAALLNLATTNVDSLWWQVENAPGWFMSVAWLVYMVMLIVYFEDPPRRMPHVAPQMGLLAAATDSEKQPLLFNNGISSGHSPPKADEPPLWKNVPVMITFMVYFVLKLILECVLSASSTITFHYFAWSAGISGLFLATLGALMLPANWCVARLARSYEDRELIMMFQVVMFIGCIVSFDDKGDGQYSVTQYVCGSILLFVSSNALEGPNMSLLSKTIPKSWSSGFFNVGLLATEAGTLGRAMADIFLTVSGSYGMENMVNQIFAALTSISVLSLLVFWRYFDQLQPMDKDE
ncbi:hypothetical protein MPSEU_000851200 [Mayamaea pseudoterrestris]|nr:hypothetical protein MPSEU_000851200 [Mayamaea pseudoterrestris]